jgi:hypothetical protein
LTRLANRNVFAKIAELPFNGDPSMSLFAKALLLLSAALALTGCATFKEVTHAKYEVGTPAKLREVPAGGLYQVQGMLEEGGRRHAVPASERILSAGDVFGFGVNPDGRVEAVAADEHFTLDRLPADARYCVWTISVQKSPSLIEQHFQRHREIARRVLGIVEPIAPVAIDAIMLAGIEAVLDGASHVGHHGSHHQSRPTKHH